MVSLGVILLFLHVVQCQRSRYAYYDDETWVGYEGEQVATDGSEIVFDDEDYKMLVSGGYVPIDPPFTKHVVSISSKRPTQYFGDNHYCTGSLIGAQLVVTAAHCFVDFENHIARPKRVQVTLGSPNRLRHTSKTVTTSVTDLLIHPDFQRNKKHDIALLFLEYRLVYRTVNIEILGLASDPPEPGIECTIIGWGQMLYMGPYASDAIYAEMKILNATDCEKAYGKDFDANGNICVGSRRTASSTCRGDSGSPLICNEKLVGVSAFGYLCGSTSVPSVFTDIISHKEWIYVMANGKEKILINHWIIYVVFLRFWSFLTLFNEIRA